MEPKSAMSLPPRELVRIVWSQRKLWMATTAACGLLAAAYSLVMPRYWEAWQGLVVPAGTPAETVTRYSKALQAALESTPVKARFQALGLEGMPGTPQQMTAFARQERDRWGKLVQSAGIKMD